MSRAVVTYCGNSGFLLEAEDDLLIFDYIADPTGCGFNMRETFKRAKHVLVFVSHGHDDHYQTAILQWADWAESVQYIVSNDIACIPPSIGAHRAAKGERFSISGWDIHCFGSTDIGVSFDVRKNGRRFFHAGDLNDWHWVTEADAEWTKKQAVDYHAIIAQIPREPRMDVAFFPVDPAMQIDYYRGARAFVQKFRPRHFVPMHFRTRFLPPDEFWTDMNGFTDVEPMDQLGSQTDMDDE